MDTITGYEAILQLGKNLYDKQLKEDGKEFTISDNLVEPYRKVFNNFTDSLNNACIHRGVLLIGGKGLGKTSLMRIMHILFKDTTRRFRYITAQKLILMLDEFKLSELIDYFTVEYPSDLYIDDIAIKKIDDVKKWGNSINIISELIHARYDLFVSKGYKTHLSSNIPPNIDTKAIAEKFKDNPEVLNKMMNTATLIDVYGERVVDRIKEMNELIIFQGESLR